MRSRLVAQKTYNYLLTTHTRKFVYILIVCKQPTKHTSFRGQRTIRVDTIRKGMEKEATSSKPLHTHRPHSFRRRQRASSEGQPSVLSQLLGRSIEHPTCLIYKCSPRTSGGDAAATRKCRALLFPQWWREGIQEIMVCPLPPGWEISKLKR